MKLNDNFIGLLNNKAMALNSTNMITINKKKSDCGIRFIVFFTVKSEFILLSTMSMKTTNRKNCIMPQTSGDININPI